MSGTEKVWLGTEGAYLGIIVLDQVPFTRTKRGSATQAQMERLFFPATTCWLRGSVGLYTHQLVDAERAANGGGEGSPGYGLRWKRTRGNGNRPAVRPPGPEKWSHRLGHPT